MSFVRMLVTRECVGRDYRVCTWWLQSNNIPDFKCAQSALFFVSQMIQRSNNYRINYGNYWKEFDSHFSVRRGCKDCHLIAHMAFFSIKSLALKWNYFFLSGIIVFVEYFNLYMKQLGFNPRPVPAEGCYRGLKGQCHDLRGYQAKRTFWFWIQNPKSKRNAVEEILSNLLFSCWLFVVGTIISNSNLSASWQFHVKSWWETTRSWKSKI